MKKRTRNVKVEEWHREKGMGHLPNLAQDDLHSEPTHLIKWQRYPWEFKTGAWENWHTVHAKCPRTDRPRSARLAACLCFCQQRSWKRGSRENQIGPFSSLRFHLPHPRFSLTTGRNLPPADTQISTDAKALPLMAEATLSCKKR